MRKLKMYILVNEDIKLGKGKLAGQVGHAVAAMFYNQIVKNGELLPIMHEYMNNHQTKVILKCPESKLLELEEKGFISIRDKGWTQLEPDTLTCVNLGILDTCSELPDEFKFVQDLKLI